MYYDMQHSGQHLAELTQWIWVIVLILEIPSPAKGGNMFKTKAPYMTDSWLYYALPF